MKSYGVDSLRRLQHVCSGRDGLGRLSHCHHVEWALSELFPDDVRGEQIGLQRGS